MGVVCIAFRVVLVVVPKDPVRVLALPPLFPALAVAIVFFVGRR